MKEGTLKEIVLSYIQRSNGFVTKGELYFEAQRQLYSPEGVGRTCRKLAELGLIKVDYYPGKLRRTKLARYASNDVPEPMKIIRKPTFVEKDGMRIAVFN